MSSCRPQESPKRPQDPPRTWRAPPLPFRMSSGGRRGRAESGADGSIEARHLFAAARILRLVLAPRRPSEPGPPGILCLRLNGSFLNQEVSNVQFPVCLRTCDVAAAGSMERCVRKPIVPATTLKAWKGCQLAPLAAHVTTQHDRQRPGNPRATPRPTAASTISQPAANEITITPDAGMTISSRTICMYYSLGVTRAIAVSLGTGTDTLTCRPVPAQHQCRQLRRLPAAPATRPSPPTPPAQPTTWACMRLYKEIARQRLPGSPGPKFQFNVSGNMTIETPAATTQVFLGVDPANLSKQFNIVAGDLTVENVTPSGRAGRASTIDALEETNVGDNITAGMGRGNQSGFAGWTSVGSLSNSPIGMGAGSIPSVPCPASWRSAASPTTARRSSSPRSQARWQWNLGGGVGRRPPVRRQRHPRRFPPVPAWVTITKHTRAAGTPSPWAPRTSRATWRCR